MSRSIVRNPPTYHINGFELFIDRSYFDMWGVRVEGCRDFNKTLHFNDFAEAEAYARTQCDCPSAGSPAVVERKP